MHERVPAPCSTIRRRPRHQAGAAGTRAESHKWGRCYLHFCQKYHHHPADAKRLPLFLEKLAAKGQTATQRAQAHCAVDYDSVFVSPQVQSWRDDAAAPIAPKDAEEGSTAKEPKSVLGAYQVREAQAQFLTPATGTRDQLTAAWEAVDGKLKAEIRLRHYAPKTLQA
ncbi:MAG: hypothetical protein ONB15_06015 [candidate division KSB1 bacterium]|nr:hypothetical protein [candidate division KSB1 bacterium]